MFVMFAPGENSPLHLSKLTVSHLAEMTTGTRFIKTIERVDCDDRLPLSAEVTSTRAVVTWVLAR